VGNNFLKAMAPAIYADIYAEAILIFNCGWREIIVWEVVVEKSARHVFTTPFSGLSPGYTHAQRNLVSTEICVYYYVQTHFGVEDGTVLFPVQIHICTKYTHRVNTYR
jgi:hypothetical protein